MLKSFLRGECGGRGRLIFSTTFGLLLRPITGLIMEQDILGPEASSYHRIVDLCVELAGYKRVGSRTEENLGSEQPLCDVGKRSRIFQ